MLVGIGEIVNSKIIGIPAVHMHTLLKTADKINHIISFRSVSPLAHGFLKSGHPTKPFHIKNKSSQNGPAAGLIPVEPLYGRPITPVENEKYLQQIAHAKKLDPLLVEGELILSKSRIEELKHLKRQHMHITYDAKLDRYTFIWHKNESKITAHANWNEQQQGYEVVDDFDQPIMVLGHMINEKFLPITADYDLLMIGFKREEWDPKLDQPAFRFQASSHRTLSEMKSYPDITEDPQKGNVCERTKNMIAMINQDIYDSDPLRKHTASPIVHHNQEAHNPFGGDVRDDFPCLFILPSTIAGTLRINGHEVDLAAPGNKILLIENAQELSLLYNVLTDHENGFYLPVHPKYQKNKIIDPFKPEQYKACKKALNFFSSKQEHSSFTPKNETKPSGKKHGLAHFIFSTISNTFEDQTNHPKQKYHHRNQIERSNRTCNKNTQIKPGTKSWHK